MDEANSKKKEDGDVGGRTLGGIRKKIMQCCIKEYHAGV